MNKTSAAWRLPELDMNYTWQNSHGEAGYASDLEAAQQECQGVAAGSLSWGTDGQIWITKDPEDGGIYQIERLPF